MSKLTDPFGRVATYTYDTVNRMKDVKTDNVLSASYEYFNNDRLKKIQHGNGISTNYTYKGFNLKTLQHKKADGTTLNSYTYTSGQSDVINSIIHTQAVVCKQCNPYYEEGHIESMRNRIQQLSPFISQRELCNICRK